MNSVGERLEQTQFMLLFQLDVALFSSSGSCVSGSGLTDNGT